MVYRFRDNHSNHVQLMDADKPELGTFCVTMGSHIKVIAFDRDILMKCRSTHITVNQLTKKTKITFKVI